MTKPFSIGKWLCFVLRHNPSQYHLSMDEFGYIKITDIVDALATLDVDMTQDQLIEYTMADDKQRYHILNDGIKAIQGHSIDIISTFDECCPPTTLYHGTRQSNIVSIRNRGLLKQRRHHVHLTTDYKIALANGNRWSQKDGVVLTVDAIRMYNDGIVFHKTQNNVWLGDNVPPQYIVW